MKTFWQSLLSSMGFLTKLRPVLGALALTLVLTARAHSAPDLLFSYHFAGMAKIKTDTNLATLGKVLALPETTKLQEEVLQKLSRTPEQLLGGKGDPESESAKLIRPLLESVLSAESICEARRGQQGPGEFLFAVRVPKADEALWEANLSKGVALLSNGKPVKTEWEKFSGWQIKRDASPQMIRAIRAGEWLVLGIGSGELPLQNNFLRRIASGNRPTEWKDQANWLEAVVDFTRLQHWMPISNSPLKPAKTEITLSGKEDSVRTVLNAVYPQPLNWKSGRWQVPTNIIRDPLVSFTAAQNISVLFKDNGSLQQPSANPLTNQFYVWSYPQVPFMTYAAMPVKDASQTIQKLGEELPRLYNAKLAKKNSGELVLATNKQSILWKGFHMLSPQLQATNDASGHYILANLFPLPRSKDPAPRELLQQVTSRTNLLFYDWELTQYRFGPLQILTKAIPLLAPALPPIPPEVLEQAKTNEAVRAKLSGRILPQLWQTKVAPMLGNATTEVSLVAPNEIRLQRKSHIGFTALELVYLTTWLNDPRFPFTSNSENVKK